MTAPLLWQLGWFYKLATLGRLGMHGAAMLGFLLRGTRVGCVKGLRLPFFFDMVCAAAGVALTICYMASGLLDAIVHSKG